jgi:hypothetical protein
MLPRWHIFWGAVFTIIVWFFAPTTPFTYLLLLFFSSFLIDFDHYLCAVIKTGKIGLFDAFKYHDHIRSKHLQELLRGLRIRGDFHLFHTIEFHALIGVVGIFWTPALYVFIGMVFHSLLDIVYMVYNDVLYRREFFLTNWIIKRI